MSKLTVEESGGQRNVKVGWIFAVVFAVLVVWMIYTASQSYVVESNSGSMSGMSETTSTQMPSMNH